MLDQIYISEFQPNSNPFLAQQQQRNPLFLFPLKFPRKIGDQKSFITRRFSFRVWPRQDADAPA